MTLSDGRRVSAPLTLFPTLRAATPRQRRAWRLLPHGVGFEWPAFDLMLSAEGILLGRRELVAPTGFWERQKRRVAALGA